MSLFDAARRIGTAAANSLTAGKPLGQAITAAVEAAKGAAATQVTPAVKDTFEAVGAAAAAGAAAGAAKAAESAASAAANPAPKSFPMAGDATLAQVSRGELVLAPGAKGESVKKLQEALELAGHKLPTYGADGDFGGETKKALVAFQKKNGIDPADGRLDANTISKLDAAAASKVKSPAYDKLFADGVLNTTIAVGYDEHGEHKPQIKQTLEGLHARGYKAFDVKTASDADLKKVGIDPAKVDRDATYFVKTFQHQGKDVQGVVKVLTPDTPNAKEKFAKAMNEDEVVMYTGHGRVGSGPDFDDKHSAAGNYVIGKPTVANYATLGENDLKKAKLTNDYQLFFFDGCNTKHYVDDLRSIPKNKDSKNLDIVGANTELSWSTSSADVLTMLDGVEGGKSMNEIQSNLEVINKEGPKDKHKHFMTDGFQDN